MLVGMSNQQSLARSYAEEFAQFISASPTSLHAASRIEEALNSAGAVRLDETSEWEFQPEGAQEVGDTFYIRRGGAVLAWRLPAGLKEDLAAGKRGFGGRAFAIVGSHTDSPGFRLKPYAHSFHHGFSQVNVETYGGLLYNSWLNRELGVAGRLVTLDGAEHLISSGPIMVIPQLAPHLDRSVNQSLSLNPQTHLHPIWAIGEHDVMEHLAGLAGLEADQVAGADLFAFDTQAPTIMNDEFFAAGRQDNLTSVFASLEAFLECEPQQIAVFATFDHEEIGSATTTGASGPLLSYTLERIAITLGASRTEYLAALAASTNVSSDAGHSINPNYPEYHDPDQHPVMGAGPMVKINANQRYASNGAGQALWLRAAHEAGQPTQEFVSNNAVSCGSTIGPLSATRLGVETVDVGVPLLSMHSARELSCIRDDFALAEILKGFWNIA